MRPLQKGEFDLANISLIGHDPVNGRTYKECKAEWDAALEALMARAAARPWWNIAEYFRINREAAILQQRLGF